MSRVPHRFIEGCLIAAHAIGSRHVFIYIRGEYLAEYEVLKAAADEARDAGLLGDVTLVLHRGAGAYICGEETALLDSLEGKRGQPRPRPPFPPIAGLYGSPTLINNVQTIANVPIILDARSRRVHEDRSRVVARHGRLLAVRQRRAARELRASTRDDVARADLRRRRRDPERPSAEGDHPRRLVGAGVHAGPDRHAGRLRLDPGRRARSSARRRSSSSTTAPAWCSSPCGPRSSTCTSRAGSARRAARGLAGWSACSRRSSRVVQSTRTSISCGTSAIASRAGRCARSATSPSGRSAATSTSTAPSSRRTSTRAAARTAASSSVEGVIAPIDLHRHSPVAEVPA